MQFLYTSRPAQKLCFITEIKGIGEDGKYIKKRIGVKYDLS